MNRVIRRRFEKEFAKIMKIDSENCTLCRKPFEHNSKTFGGLTNKGKTVLTGECCESLVEYTFASGIYATRNFDSFPPPGTPSKTVPAEQLGSKVDAIQNYLSGLDRMSSEIMRKGGLQGKNGNINFADAPWKTADAEWFLKNPNRSHRLRPMFDGEQETVPPSHLPSEIPPDHRMEILVRQIEVGKRIRLPFCRNTKQNIPDTEEFIHAMFDTFSQPGARIVSGGEVAALAEKFLRADTGKPN